VSKKLNARVVGNPTSNGILWIRIRTHGGSDVYIAVVYAPQASCPKFDRELFFDELRNHVSIYKKKGSVILMGDFNARVGLASKPNDHVGMYGEPAKNANCALMWNLLKSENLYALNSRKAGKGTFTRIRSGVKSILDYIVVDESIFSRQHSCTVMEDLDCGSDHHPVVAKIHVTGSKYTCKKNSTPRLRTWKLKEPLVLETFQRKLDDRLSDWVKEVQSNTSDASPELIEHFWMSWKSQVYQTAKEVLGTCSNNGFLKPWWNKEIKSAIKYRRKVYQQVKDLPQTEWEPYYSAARQVKHLVSRAKRDHWLRFMDEIEQSLVSDSRSFFNLTKRLDRRKKSRSRFIPIECKVMKTYFESLGSC
jgi:hypothetical protein